MVGGIYNDLPVMVGSWDGGGVPPKGWVYIIPGKIPWPYNIDQSWGWFMALGIPWFTMVYHMRIPWF